ncbi:adenylate/guanylate cyclase [Leptospira ryugenii]|uniref:Adenylate/guanylate cyclase n=1 Tax=Leptospira ryugenii TaxID=1917863 RepID=A0A2P2DYH2_9LEPT|nr:7TM diverse intracellular signaling domain-containing protein [Leptospira ryugenii]GBF49650.1 adenylate/guanylate cyclase [Leptospira ryugenii]
MRKTLTYFLLCTLFALLGHCKVKEGGDGSGVFHLKSGEYWLYGNTSAKYWLDPHDQATLDDILSLREEKWSQTGHNATFGILDAALWIRLDVSNQTEIEKWFLSIDSASLISINLFYLNPNNDRYEHLQAGRRIAKPDILYPYKHPVFPLEFKKNETKRLYFHVRTAGPTFVPLRFFQEEEFISFVKLSDLMSGFYYGGMILLLCYNLILFFSIREKLFFFYCCYIFFFLLFIFNSMNQWMPFIDFSQNEFILNLSPISSIAATLAATIFAKAFLFPKKEGTRIEKLINVAIFLNAFSVVVISLFPYTYQTLIANVVPLYAILVISYSALYRFQQGFSGARYFLIAWSFLLVSVSFFILMNLGVFDYSSFIAYSPLYGSFLEGIFLSLGIGDRINSLTKEREQARKDLIDSQKKALDEEKKLNESISRFVPNQFLEILKRKSILEVARGDSVERQMTILFSDIRNFTVLSESNSAKDVFLILNEYMECLGPIIAKHNGFIDKYIGDAIMALFPLRPEDAVMAALEMHKEVERMRLQYAENFHLDAGFGIHHGNVMLGTVGESKRLDTTVIGDAVNLASRLEGLTKYFSLPILVSDSVRKHCMDSQVITFREIDAVIVKGKTKPVVVYEAYAPNKTERQEEVFYSLLFQGMQFFKGKDFDKALSSFQEYQKHCPNDPLVRVYLTRCEEFLKNPPPEEWTGYLKF